MSNLELFVSSSPVFGGLQKPLRKAEYVVLGVPFDVTSTYRTGARFGPTAIRQASLNIETFSFRMGIDFEDLSVHDLGDLHVSAATNETLDTLKLVIKDIATLRKLPVTIGGEHSITFGIMKGLSANAAKTAIVCFDAHLDLRYEFLGSKLSHTTFMRCINEEVKPARIIEVGTRAVCKEELAYAKNSGIEFFSAQEIRKKGSKRIAQLLKEKLAEYSKVYLSVDMDVLDPAYAPAVQNPEPEGIETHTMLNILCALCDKRVIGLDVSEVAPNYDQGVSAVQAAKVIFEALLALEHSRKIQSK